MGYIYLTIAIVAEVIGTSALKASEEFTRLWPSVTVVISYMVSFYFLAMVLKTIPVGIAYAIWSGLGVALISLLGVLLFKESLDLAGSIGIALIVSGVLVINLFSKSSVH